MKINDAVSQVRNLINDLSGDRYSDDDLLRYGQEILRRMAIIRPDLFTIFDEITNEEGNVFQKAPDNCLRLEKIVAVKDGNIVREVQRQTMDQSDPNWINDSQGPCQHWMRNQGNERYYYIYPKAPRNQTLIAEYVYVPELESLDTDFDLPIMYLPSLVDGMVWLAESVNDESVNNGRAEKFYGLFLKSLTDDWTNKGGIQKAQRRE